MLAKFTVAALVLGFQLAEAAPVYFPRTVTSLDQSQIAEAQPRDDTATRAFTAAPIKVFLFFIEGVRSTSSHKCTDFRWAMSYRR